MGMGNDIGSVGVIRTTESVSESSESHRSVYRVTHLADGKSDSYMNRSFISFSFGGKNIEDFNLIACNTGDRLERQLTGNFNDLITSYDVINGQYYWGTYFTNNEMSFTLVTDGITQPELEDFIHWFKPGETKELILAEHPNRAIMARVAEPPVLSTIPFEEKVEFNLDGGNVKTSTTLYKGEIQLNFIMDEPFWYSKINLLVRQNEFNIWMREWIDANNEAVSVLESKDALKIIYEDGIPTLSIEDKSMMNNIFFLGNNLFFLDYGNNAVAGSAIVGSAKLNYSYEAEEEIKIDLRSGTNAYLYYAGTAPERPKISFSFDTSLVDSLIKLNNDNSNYSFINFTSKNEQKLLLNLPSVFYSYNKIINIFRDKNIITYGRMKEKIREEVHHYYAKKWASCVLNFIEERFNSLSDYARSSLIAYMKKFIQNKETNTQLLNTYIFDPDNNKYVGKLGYRIAGDTAPSNYSDWNNFGDINETEEDISEVIHSDYIILSERNYLNNNYTIQPWTNNNPTSSYKITHNFRSVLKNLVIEYKNKYY